VVILLPAVLLVLLVFSYASGSTELMVLMPMVLVVAAGGIFVTFVLREGQARRDLSVRRMPTDHLRRQVYMALRPQRRAIRLQREQQEQEPAPDPEEPPSE
jgi:hypothetical protein